MTKILDIFNKFLGEDKKTFVFFKHRFQESQFFNDKIFSFKVNQQIKAPIACKVGWQT